MQNTTDPNRKPMHRMLDELNSLRDEIRAKLKLAKQHTHQRWLNLERQLTEIEHQIRQQGGVLSEASRKQVAEMRTALSVLLGGAVDSVRVENVMNRQLHTVGMPSSMATVARTMWEHDCGIVPIVSGGKLIGVITDRDVCMAAYTQGKPLEQVDVSVGMSRPVETSRIGDSLSQVLSRIANAKVRRLPVLDEKDELCGMISIGDIARFCARTQDSESRLTAEAVTYALATICEPRVQVRRTGT